MSNYKIPNTQVSAQILTPAPGSSYVSLFLGYGEQGNGKNMISVNAGTSNVGSVFAVGLAGINGAFASSLGNAGQTTGLYQNIHQDLYNAAGTGTQAFKTGFGATDPVVFSMIQKPDPSFGLPDYDGIVFIDVFNPSQVPHGNPLNYAMLYLVPPYNSTTNYPNNSDFLAAIKATCITLVTALNTYHSSYATPGNKYGLQPINNVRMCLFSGGYYSGDATADQVALANLQGLETGFGSSPNTVSLVEFEYSNVAQWLS